MTRSAGSAPSALLGGMFGISPQTTLGTTLLNLIVFIFVAITAHYHCHIFNYHCHVIIIISAPENYMVRALGTHPLIDNRYIFATLSSPITIVSICVAIIVAIFFCYCCRIHPHSLSLTRTFL